MMLPYFAWLWHLLSTLCDIYPLLTMKFQCCSFFVRVLVSHPGGKICCGLWSFPPSKLFPHVTYTILFPSVHCVLIFYHIITRFTIAYLYRICYVCFLNTTVPLPSLYFLVIKVWYILNSCLRRSDLSCLHSTVQWSNGKL